MLDALHILTLIVWIASPFTGGAEGPQKALSSTKALSRVMAIILI